MMVILISVRLILQRGFDLHFSNNYMLSIFSCDCWLSVCLVWRNTKNILLWRVIYFTFNFYVHLQVPLVPQFKESLLKGKLEAVIQNSVSLVPAETWQRIKSVLRMPN